MRHAILLIAQPIKRQISNKIGEGCFGQEEFTDLLYKKESEARRRRGEKEKGRKVERDLRFVQSSNFSLNFSVRLKLKFEL